MPDLDRRQLALYAAGLLVVLVLGARYLARGDVAADPPGARGGGGHAIRVERSGGGPVVVHVAGAVRHPGVYRLAGGARVAEAVERAGGATRRAELGGVNLAAKLEDGRQIVVPERARAGTSPAPGSAAAAVGPAGAAAGAVPSAPVNLNTGTPEQLDTLPGVGPATVQKIIEYREQHGVRIGRWVRKGYAQRRGMQKGHAEPVARRGAASTCPRESYQERGVWITQELGRSRARR